LVVEEDPPSENKDTVLMERYEKRIKARMDLVLEIVRKEFCALYNQNWCLDVMEQDWISRDQWMCNKEVDITKKSVQNFGNKSESFYSLCGGISDAFAAEGGICLGSMCHGPETILINEFRLVNDPRVDLRGLNSYSQASRGYISCWNLSALAWSLKKCNYSVSLSK